jgi:hypothetical protein
MLLLTPSSRVLNDKLNDRLIQFFFIQGRSTAILAAAEGAHVVVADLDLSKSTYSFFIITSLNAVGYNCNLSSSQIRG